MTDLIWGLYPLFLDAEYGPSLFWELSIWEINDLLESYARRKEREQKQREAALKDEIMLLFNQALQVGNMVRALMDENTEIRLPKDYYPDLFEAETDSTGQEEDKSKLDGEMELHKARMDDFIFRHNMAMREKLSREGGESNGRDDTGETPSDHRGPDKGILRGTEESTEADEKGH